MKKNSIIIAAIAAAAALAAASCTKSEAPQSPEAPEQAKTLKLNLDIPSLGSAADTKAAKTVWAAGDKLNIWFDDWCPAEDTSPSVKPGTPEPDLVISYDGTKWTAGELKMSDKSDGTARSLKASGGKMTVVYEGYNDLSKYTTSWYRLSEWYHPTSKQVIAYSNDTYASTLVAYIEGVGYTYDESSNTLTATLTGWKFYTTFKVLVKTSDTSIKDNADGYALQVSYETAGASTGTPTTEYANSTGAVVVNASGYPTIGNGSSNNKGLQLGVEETDGIAFYYAGLGTISTATDIKFTLLKLGSYPGGETTASYTATGKTFTNDDSKCQGVSIDHSKFATE